MVVSEVFGPTLQGEGPEVGATAVFLRLGMCALDCSWCDTRYTWDAGSHNLTQELTHRAPSDVVADVLSRKASLLVVTGGEPLLQRATLTPVLQELVANGLRVHVETSGTVPPGTLRDLVELFVVSPKLAGSGVAVRRRYRPGVLTELVATGRSVLKFVITGPADMQEAEEIAHRLGVPGERVWVMPEATSTEAVLSGMRALAPEVVNRGWRLSPRLHVLLWEDLRGV